jgi:hypothetical protein
VGFFEDMIAECREAEADEVADDLEHRVVPPHSSAGQYSELGAPGYRPLRGPAIGDDMLRTWPERYAALCLRDHLDGGVLQPQPVRDPVLTEAQAAVAHDVYGNAYQDGDATVALRSITGRKPVVALTWSPERS